VGKYKKLTTGGGGGKGSPAVGLVGYVRSDATIRRREGSLKEKKGVALRPLRKKERDNTRNHEREEKGYERGGKKLKTRPKRKKGRFGRPHKAAEGEILACLSALQKKTGEG